MKLWYIALYLDKSEHCNEFLSEFVYRTRYVGNYFSKQIRKLRFETDGTYNMICVTGTQNGSSNCALVPLEVLDSYVEFDMERYERIKETGDCEYYLEMLDIGFRNAARIKEIPLQHLLDLISEFRKGGCKNEWLHKKKRFKELDVEISLNCYFTSFDFKLVATITRISTREVLCSGVILETLPDEIFFAKEFKNILLGTQSFIVTDFLDRPNIYISIKKALRGEFSSKTNADLP